MHCLATFQDGVSFFHQALSSKHSGSDELGDCDWDCVSTANHSMFFFFFKAYSTISFFQLAGKENVAFQVQSLNSARQSISRCNRQLNCSFKWAHPSEHANTESAGVNYQTAVLPKDLVCVTRFMREKMWQREPRTTSISQSLPGAQ